MKRARACRACEATQTWHTAGGDARRCLPWKEYGQ